MKSIYHIKAAMLALAAMVACTEYEIIDESLNSVDNGLIQELSITGKDFRFDDQTRSSVTIGESGASFTWDEDDVIGIFPDKGDQVSFAMEEGAGTQTAKFSGGGWALKSSAKYAAYYPHVYENRDMTAIPVSYVNQTQNGNGNTDHIGAYDFMAAGVSTPENGAVAFDMQHLGALIQLTITVPEPSTLRRVVLNSSTSFIKTGTINLNAERPAITAKTQSNTVEIALNNVTTTEADETVTVYFMMAPVDLTDQSLKAVIEKDNHYYQEVELTGKNFEAGKAYRLSAKMATEEESPSIINVATAGTFEETIRNEYGSKCLELTSLKVIGNLNGSDIRFIRKMAGRKEDGSSFASGNNLLHLDLTQANIVAGGDYYYVTKTGTKYYTENNVAGDFMFYFCNLKTIKFPQTITKLGKQVCSHMPTSQGNENIAVGTDHIGTFTSIEIPSGVTIVDEYALAWNQNLSSITLPDNVKSLGFGAFYRCDALTSINIPDSVESCPCFLHCHGLQYVRLSENPEFDYMGYGVFIGCRSLKTLTIPANIATISSNAFGNEGEPSALEEIHFKSATPPSLNENSGLPTNCIIYVPEASYSAYTTNAAFRKYARIRSE